MDKPVHEIRLSNWIKIVSACQSRPKGVTQKQWISVDLRKRHDPEPVLLLAAESPESSLS